MKYIILAAGIGSRLLPETERVPKILVPVKEGKTTLDFQLRSVALHPFIEEIIIVVGYKAERIQEHLDRFYADYPIPITVIHNSRYRETGPIYSLSLAIARTDQGDFMIVNGDVVYELSLLEVVPTLQRGSTLFIGSIASLDGDSLKVTLLGSRVLAVGKIIQVEKADGLSMGIFVVKGETAARQVRQATEQQAQLDPKGYWHSMVDAMAQHGHIEAYLDSTHSWQEIDNQVDLQNASREPHLSYA